MNAFCCMFFLLSIKEEEHLHTKIANTKKQQKKQIINKREYNHNKWTCNNGHKFSLNW